MEQNKELSARESLALINETLNNSRQEITRRSGKYLLLWGLLLTVFSLLVFVFWKATGKPYWNFLWFVMPVIGFIAAAFLNKKETVEMPDNAVSRILAGIWRTFGVFAVSVALFTIIYSRANVNPLGTVASVVNLTPMILLLFGMAETVSGVAVRNRAITVAGFLTGVGGLIVCYLLGSMGEADGMLLFTFAGVILAATGLIVKRK